MRISKCIITVTVSFLVIASFLCGGIFAAEVISLGDSDAACAAWSDHGNRIMASRLIAGKWSSPVALKETEGCPEHTPSVIAGPDGSLHVVWIKDEGDNSFVFYSRYGAAGWSEEERVNTKELVASQPAVCLDGEGNPAVVWSASEDGDESVYFSRRIEGVWDEQLRVSRLDGRSDFDPAIGVDSKGQLVVAWSGFDGKGYAIQYSVLGSEGWSEEAFVAKQRAATDSSEMPALIREPDSLLKVLWMQDSRVVSSVWNGEDWTPAVPEQVSVSVDGLTAMIHGIHPAQVSVSWIEGGVNNSLRWSILKQDSGNPLPGSVSSVRTTDRSWAEFLSVDIQEAYAAVDLNTYLCFGDSITSGYGTSGLGGYPALLQPLLASAYGVANVINSGVSGEQAVTGAGRVGGTLASSNPGYILILEGTNDIGHGRSSENVVESLRSIVNQALGFGTIPVLATLTPRFDGYAARANRTSAAIRVLAGEMGVALCDLEAVFYSKSDLESYYADGRLHPNDRGYDIMAHAWFSTIQSIKGGGGDGGGCGYVTAVPGSGTGINLLCLLAVPFLIFICRRFRPVRAAAGKR